MLEAILQECQTSTYDFRVIANPADPLIDRFPVWVDYYRLKWAIARIVKPQRILEIGVRYGYAAHAFLDAVPQSQYTGIDLDCAVAGGVPGAIDWAAQILQPFQTELIVADSQAMHRFPGDRYDLIHLDGQQDGDSSCHDLQLALQQGDYILLDGYHWSNVNFLAVNDWLLQQRDRIAWYGTIPGYAGELLIKPLQPQDTPPIQHSHQLQSAYDQTYYTQSCDGYASFAQYRGQRLVDERLMGAATIASLKPAGHVLDLGCGRGELAMHFAQRGYQVTAIDYSEAAIALAQSGVAAQPQYQPQITFHCADVNQIDLPLAHYDLVIATDLIEHLSPDEVATLYDRINGWLKPDGLCLIHTFPNRWYYQYDYARKRRQARQLGAYLPANPRTAAEKLMHINEQSPRVLQRQLAAAFAHRQIWFAPAGHHQLGGSLTRSFSHRELAASPSLYAIASPQPLPLAQLQTLWQIPPIRWFAARRLRDRLHLTIVAAPTAVPAGASLEIQVQLTNHSQQVLHSFGPYPIHWSYRWCDAAGRPIVTSGDRTRISPPSWPHTADPTIGIPTAGQIQDAPGTAYYVKVKPPDQPGTYQLQVTLVQEQVRWFDQSPIDLQSTCTIVVTAIPVTQIRDSNLSSRS
jgi:2-polyprenyl-3-methyl-5-hydroxy-6-metoxy-1,4-benzoquinol methylase